LQKLLDQEPPSYLVLRDLGVIYADPDLGEEKAAVAYLEEAIRLYPGDPEPYRKLAEIERRAGRPLEAGMRLVEAADVAAAPYEDLMTLATLAKEDGKGEVEALALERILALRPYDRETVARLARLYRDAGDAAQAVRTYEVLCLLSPDDVEAHQALVELALEHGPRETARRYAERLRELDPGNVAARRALERP
jgi:predicted Zn-dependent protease